jgi:hypothetical protein
MWLFQFSICFEQPRAYHQENQLYQYNIWYMSLCVGDRFVCRSERSCSSFPTCTPCSKQVENWNKHIEKKCVSSWSFTKNHNKMHGQQNIKFSSVNFFTNGYPKTTYTPFSKFYDFRVNQEFEQMRKNYYTMCSCRSISYFINVVQNCALLSCYTERSGNSLPTFRDNLSPPLKMGAIGCSKTSVRNCHCGPCNSPEERNSHLLRSGSLKSRTVNCVAVHRTQTGTFDCLTLM